MKMIHDRLKKRARLSVVIACTGDAKLDDIIVKKFPNCFIECERRRPFWFCKSSDEADRLMKEIANVLEPMKRPRMAHFHIDYWM